ncbi:unnamed protein product [Discula destructiva]
MDNFGIPVLLLKTKSTPGDGYQDIFSQPVHGLSYRPSFVPVLEHKFEDHGMARVESILKSRDISKHSGSSFGGLIFTSQRAVEAFTKLVKDCQGSDKRWPFLQDVPVYSVGPATTRALKAVPQEPPLQVFGEHTGNGNKLAQFILDHYGKWYEDRPEKLPLLFLVGEQRRDIIPRTLQDDQLPKGRRIPVDEIIVYGTAVMDTFPEDFKQCLERIEPAKMTWIVVFSPTGCDAMLKGLGMLDASTGKAMPKDPDRTRFIATIGPTTQEYLKTTFDFEPDVCAEEPSPDGVLKGISRFVLERSTL